MVEQPKPRALRKGSSSKDRTSRETTQQQPLALDDSAAVEDIRRANLHVLTARNGSKARLGVVMAMSGSNMAHRLYGTKRMDSVEANRFTERLGLPTGWLDTPRSEAEISEPVSRLLTPASRGRASVEQHEPLAAATKDGVPGKPADAEARPRRPRAGVLGDSQKSSPLSADATAEKETIGVSPEDRASDAPDEPAGRSPEESDGDVPAATPATLPSLPAAVIPQRSAVPLPFASVTSLNNLQGIEPIAEALLKTLAGKARTGRLDELKALELLQQAVLL
jgi:hypothetical protein